MPGLRPVPFPMQAVNLRTDPPDGLVIPVSDPCLPLTMLEKGVEPGKMQPPLQPQRRHPKAIIPINTPRNINKKPHFTMAFNGTHNDTRGWLSGRFSHDGKNPQGLYGFQVSAQGRRRASDVHQLLQKRDIARVPAILTW